LDVSIIIDDVAIFAMQELAYKLLRKCCRYEVLAAVIAIAEKCVEGIQMNWAMFLVNQFLIDYIDTQEKGTKFQCAWLIILIAIFS